MRGEQAAVVADDVDRATHDRAKQRKKKDKKNELKRLGCSGGNNGGRVMVNAAISVVSGFVRK